MTPEQADLIIKELHNLNDWAWWVCLAIFLNGLMRA